ncbi:pig-W [Schizosaccharomyces cryophilus OY26]|uniref:GPI-anchored wall transfer protein n=1 Tax=Schizosaccharomyces cryophilus (strain OY26 / ATCC MYA-4695 / CBS 11777 / NBRC 106824 / NRRL Y48691) TaxID=653667 RepID=S9VVV1_SCHCR|nr:pig-W [Schizosaccharomyces cryophilus OY26]EPY50310.1 pig-W [Schizosaccharomyces cryophilus OY26]
MSRKLEKELFVSNTTGCSVLETTVMICIGLACCVLWSSMKVRKIFPEKGLARFLSEFFIFGLVPLFAIHISSNIHPLLLTIAFFVPSVFLHYSSPINWNYLKRIRNNKGQQTTDTADYDHRIASVTFYRSQMMLATVTCILAVDFPFFPRKHAKVETWGISLMDLGVGSFMFSSGTVAGRKNDIKQPGAFKKVLLNAFILFLLGIFRIFLTKGIEYQEHVTEYGVHWNFFFTLSFMSITIFILRKSLSKLSYFYLATSVTVLHHFLLVCTPFQRWVLSAPRTDIFSQNKEGIASLLGYTSIFLYGMHAGSILLVDRPRMYTRAESWKRFQKLFFPLVSLISLYFVSDFFTNGISRRLANTPYVTVVAFANLFFLCLYLLYDAYIFPPSFPYSERVPVILESANNNGLLVFLLGNILTGLVNLTFDTLHSSNVKGLLILTVYLFIICYGTDRLEARGIRFRL